MDYPSWVEDVFNRVSRRWQASETDLREGVPLLVECLAPDLAETVPHDDLFTALVDAFVDLDWLGLVADPEIHDPTLIQATPNGMQAMSEGFLPVVRRCVQERCDGLSRDELSFLVALIETDREQRVESIAPRLLYFPTAQIYRRAFGSSGDPAHVGKTRDALADEFAWDLWRKGLVIRRASEERDAQGFPKMIVAALLGGFVCVDALARQH